MTKEEFWRGFELLRDSFTDFIVNVRMDEKVQTRVMSTWHKYLGEYDARDYAKAVDAWILSMKKAPTIADLKEGIIHERYERQMIEKHGTEEERQKKILENFIKNRTEIIFTKEFDTKLINMGCITPIGINYTNLKKHYFAGEFSDEENEMIQNECHFTKD